MGFFGKVPSQQTCQRCRIERKWS